MPKKEKLVARCGNFCQAKGCSDDSRKGIFEGTEEKDGEEKTTYYCGLGFYQCAIQKIYENMAKVAETAQDAAGLATDSMRFT